MLAFNLGKPDRILLRKGIASGRIRPEQLNVMSSTDLADEQTKLHIEVAEKEALAHSILQKITAPRAKITHKGFEAIEDSSGASSRNPDAIRDEEEERMRRERREREKLARVRSVSQSQGQGSPTTPTDPNAPAMSPALPMSPVVGQSESWGAPPPLPSHVSQQQVEQQPLASPGIRPPSRPLFVPSASDFNTSMEGGLSLADLINIDDDMMPQEGPQTPQTSHAARAFSTAESGSTASPTPEVVTPSGPSPFAQSKPLESPRQSSFDLSNIWTGEERMELTKEPASAPAVPDDNNNEGEAMEIDSPEEEPDDTDFDAFLERDEKAGGKQDGPTAPAQPPGPPDFNSLPAVWTGSVSRALSFWKLFSF